MVQFTGLTKETLVSFMKNSKKYLFPSLKRALLLWETIILTCSNPFQIANMKSAFTPRVFHL